LRKRNTENFTKLVYYYDNQRTPQEEHSISMTKLTTLLVITIQINATIESNNECTDNIFLIILLFAVFIRPIEHLGVFSGIIVYV